MYELERAVAGLRGRIRRLLWAKYAVALIATWGFIWGTAVLIGRVGLHLNSPDLTWGALGLLPILALAGWLAMRKTPDAATVRAWIDRRSHAGGLAMTAAQADIGPWSEQLPPLAEPTLCWRGGRAWVMLLAATAFVTTAFLLPHDTAAVSEQQRLNVQSQAAELRTQIRTLKEENLLDPQTAERMQREVDDLANNASARDPMKTFEALDHLARGLKREADQATEQAMAKTEQAASMQAAAETVQQAAPEMAPESLKQAMAEMVARAEQARNEGTLPHLDEQALKQLQELAERDAEALARLAEQAKTRKELGQLTEQMATLGERALARMADAGEVTLFQPDETITAAALTKTMPNDDYAVRGTGDGDGAQPTVFKSTFGERMQLDPQVKRAVFGEGEKIVAMAGQQRLDVYQPAGEGARNALDELTDDQAATVNVAGAVALYERDEQATQRANNAQQSKDNEIDQSMQQLAEAANAQGMNLQQMVEALADARMVDPEAMRRLEQAGRIDRKALTRLLEEAKQQGMDGRTLYRLAEQSIGPSGATQAAGGTGNINRGRGDAPMTWKDPSSTENTAFKEQTLPADGLDPRQSERIGVSTGAPDEEAGSASTGGLLRGAEADGGSVNRQRVLPRHREAVEGYFGTKADQP